MALVVATLTTGLIAAGVRGLAVPPASVTRQSQADAYIDAYDDYASTALSCASATPTSVEIDAARNKLREVFDDNPPDFQTPAEGWAEALSLYWDGALFGAGVVTVPGLKATLSEPLATLWEVSQGTPSDPVSILTAMAVLIDVFTKTVVVSDVSIPCIATIT